MNQKYDSQISELQSHREALEAEAARKAHEAEAILAKVNRVLDMGDVQEENVSLKVSEGARSLLSQHS